MNLQTLKCKLGFHKKGYWEPSIGIVAVCRCYHCYKILDKQKIVGKHAKEESK